jgi:hypothetical protein
MLLLLLSIVAVALGVALAVLAVRRSAAPKETLAVDGLAQMPAVALRGTGACDFDIVREAECQEALEQICRTEFGKAHDHQCAAILIPGARSAHATVRVEIDGRQVGRLSEAASQEHLRRMSLFNLAGRKASCNAVITFSDADECYQVRLDIQWPPEPDTADDAGERPAGSVDPPRLDQPSTASGGPR